MTSSESRRGRARRAHEQQGVDRNRPTLMIRNLPIRITTEILEQQLEQMGLAGKYDLLHIPRDAHKPDCSLGYAFINLRDAAVASQVERAAKGLSWASFSNSEKVCEVEFARLGGLTLERGDGGACAGVRARGSSPPAAASHCVGTQLRGSEGFS